MIMVGLVKSYKENLHTEQRSCTDRVYVRGWAKNFDMTLLDIILLSDYADEIILNELNWFILGIHFSYLYNILHNKHVYSKILSPKSLG